MKPKSLIRSISLVLTAAALLGSASLAFATEYVNRRTNGVNAEFSSYDPSPMGPYDSYDQGQSAQNARTRNEGNGGIRGGPGQYKVWSECIDEGRADEGCLPTWLRECVDGYLLHGENRGIVIIEACLGGGNLT